MTRLMLIIDIWSRWETVWSVPHLDLHVSTHQHQLTAVSESVASIFLQASQLMCHTIVSAQRSKSWRFHSSRFKSLIRSWILLMSSLSVAPKAIWNMYPVAAMWVTEGWTQRQTLEYLCSYDHQNQLLVKGRRCSLIVLLKYMNKKMDSWKESAR